MFSFRLYDVFHLSEIEFNQLLKLFEKYEGLTDALTFFTTATHAPIPISSAKERMSILSVRMKEARKRGFKAGVNVMTTIGHHNENLAYSLNGPYTNMTDIDGIVSRGSFCPNDPNMRQYIKELYQIVTLAEPEYIWIDDDVRLAGHRPISYTCFCDTCIQLFNEQTKGNYTKESLKVRFNDGPEAEKLAIRLEWLQHNRNTLNRLLSLIEQTVHEISPELPIGFMSGERFYEGYDFAGMERVLSKEGKTKVMWRPGGGFYWDTQLAELTSKSHQIGRQVSLLPDRVRDIQSEIENYPYQRLRKSDRITAVEVASHIAAGCTGAAFNVLSLTGGEHYEEEYGPLISKLHATRPFYDVLVEKLGRSKPIGLYTGWNIDSFAANRLTGDDWFKGSVGSITGSQAQELFDLGLPPAYSVEYANVTLLAGESARIMDEKQIEKILSNGVYMDAGALKCLRDMGYGKFIGFNIDRFEQDDCIEQFTEHPLNGDLLAKKRDSKQSFWNEPAAILIATDSASSPLSRIVNYANEEVGACGMGIYENNLGGRICVAGYYPWKLLQNKAKTVQIRKLMRWLSKDRIPAYIDSFQKCHIWVREMPNGRYGIVLLNSSMDQATDLRLMIRTDAKKIRITDMQCQETIVSTHSEEGTYREFIIPHIGNWEVMFVEVI